MRGTSRRHPSGGREHGLPIRVAEAWRTAVARLKGAVPAEWLWSGVLTADERRRLGGDLEAAYRRDGGAVGMWRRLHGVSVPQAVVAVGAALNTLDAATGRGLLRELGEAPEDPAEAVAHAVAGGGLVLVEFPRQAFWGGVAVAVDWVRHARPWALLWDLARESKAGRGVDAFTFEERAGGDPKAVTKLKSRLVNLDGFPVGLGDRVVPAGRGTYRLDLPADRIRVFARGAGDAVREWRP